MVMDKNQMPDTKLPQLPKDFLWGASVSAHQVEGGNHNQWTVWEEKSADSLAQHAPKRYGQLSRWQDIKKQAENPKNYISGIGVDHFNRFKDDFKLIKSLNLNSFRFGIEWSRIEPEEGQWDQNSIEHYRGYIAELKKLGIEPVLNIWHWTVPVWFEDKGGFTHTRNLKYFDRFVQKLGAEYAHDLKYIITLNEPNVYSSLSFLTGKWPPQQKNLFTAIRVYKNLVKAHRMAYKTLKNIKPDLQIGIAAQLANFQAKRSHDAFGQLSTKLMRYFWNWWFINRINKHQDYVGFNYYFTHYYNGLFKQKNPKYPVNDLGWYMEPEGIYPLLLKIWSKYKKPIIITENGLADAKDEHRRWWIEQTMVAIERASSDGINVIGYFHWSLLDNFEWAEGWWPKFGLVEVDRQNDMKRKIRPSAEWFAKKIAEQKK